MDRKPPGVIRAASFMSKNKELYFTYLLSVLSMDMVAGIAEQVYNLA